MGTEAVFASGRAGGGDEQNGGLDGRWMVDGWSMVDGGESMDGRMGGLTIAWRTCGPRSP